MHSAVWTWELRRMREYAGALLCFSVGLLFAASYRADAIRGDIDLDAFFYAMFLGAFATADGNSFETRGGGAPDLGFLLSRPVGRLELFLGRLGAVCAFGGLVWLMGVIVGAVRANGVACLSAAWWNNWGIAFACYLFMSLAMLGFMTEPQVPLVERLRRNTFMLKMAPLVIIIFLAHDEILWVA